MIAVFKNLFKEKEYKLNTLFLSLFLLFFTLGCRGGSDSLPQQEPATTTYSWSTGTWSLCSGVCGTNNATQTRIVTCTASTGESVGDGMCSETKPGVSQTCTASECPVNNLPVINTAFSDVSLVQNSDTANYEINVSDADGDSLTLTVESNNSSIITVDQNWTNPINQASYAIPLDFNLTTVTDAFGLVKITIIADDGEANTTASFDVNVTEVITRSIKKTGQTKSYDSSGNEVTDSSIKDDGFYQKGVDHNYTRDDVNYTVTDNVTGLMWQDDAEAASVTKPWLTSANYTICSEETSSDVCYDTSGDTATTYCSQITTGGYADWRLPTVEELEGIVDYGKVSPAIDTTFQNTTSDYYWSATTYEAYRHYVWFVGFYDGYVSYSNKNNSFYVRCVRDEQ